MKTIEQYALLHKMLVYPFAFWMDLITRRIFRARRRLPILSVEASLNHELCCCVLEVKGVAQYYLQLLMVSATLIFSHSGS